MESIYPTKVRYGIFIMGTQRSSLHVFRIMYDFVEIPEYRKKVCEEPYPEVLKKSIKKMGYDYTIEIVELEIPEDHIHRVVRSEHKISPSDIMQFIKVLAAREFFKYYPEIKKHYFWGGKLSTQSYFVETIQNANEETIRA